MLKAVAMVNGRVYRIPAKDTDAISVLKINGKLVITNWTQGRVHEIELEEKVKVEA